MTAPALAELALAAEPAAWAAAGFRVEVGAVTVGGVTLRLLGTGAGRRIVDCSLRGVGDAPALDRLPVSAAMAAGPPPEPAGPHPNGVRAIDHLVAFTPDLDRTVAAGVALGLDLRRIRDEAAPAGSPRQAFFRLGELMLEVAQAPEGSPVSGDDPARFYGLAFVVDDLEAAAASASGLLGEPRDAVQPGRRIATYRREAGLGLPVALMTPRR
ncbi:MAG: VOC family protein [Solirubrobacterales bacterium]|nr:VOC family protein [Solirubrobacterales bacterium]